MTCHCSTSRPFVVTGTADQIAEVLIGPRQHDEHMRGYRWHQYVAADEKRWENVKAELRRMHQERREREALLDAAELQAAE